MGGDASHVGSIIVLSLRASRHKRIEPSALIKVTIGLLYGESDRSITPHCIILSNSFCTAG